MKISKKCQYALRAIFELAWRNNGQPVKTHQIAKSQRMSVRFTEVILNELKHGGFVESRRGNGGGYLLAQDVGDIVVREVIEYIEGPVSVAPEAVKNNANVAFAGAAAFKGLWDEINNAVCEVCDNKSFADLVEFERAKRNKCALNYSI